MSGIGAAIERIEQAITARIRPITPFRAVVTSVDGGLIGIKRVGAATGEGRTYASCGRFLLAVGDEVLCANLNGEPIVIDRIRRLAHTAPTFTAQAGAGSTASTASSVGSDDVGFIQLVPGGSGIASGQQVVIAFAEAMPDVNYSIKVQPFSSAARAVGSEAGPTGRQTGQWSLTADNALSTGVTYQWSYERRRYPV